MSRLVLTAVHRSEGHGWGTTSFLGDRDTALPPRVGCPVISRRVGLPPPGVSRRCHRPTPEPTGAARSSAGRRVRRPRTRCRRSSPRRRAGPEGRRGRSCHGRGDGRALRARCDSSDQSPSHPHGAGRRTPWTETETDTPRGPMPKPSSRGAASLPRVGPHSCRGRTPAHPRRAGRLRSPRSRVLGRDVWWDAVMSQRPRGAPLPERRTARSGR